jgi:acyl dehydratase
MGIDLESVGRTTAPALVRWTERDVLLYAVAVGAGQSSASEELYLTTENSDGIELRVLPTFAITLVHRVPSPSYGPVDRAMVLHGEQYLDVRSPIPVDGEAQLTSEITSIEDKGSGALVVTETVARLPESGEILFTTRSASFVRGEGGFGQTVGAPSPGPEKLPSRDPDLRVASGSRPDQALLYRLTGDRNPLHSDPSVASRAGFDRPILHGLCTFGITARMLIHAVCHGDPERVRGISGRFSRVVYPGEGLAIDVWVDGSFVRFRTSTDSGVVLDRGAFSYDGAGLE